MFILLEHFSFESRSEKGLIKKERKKERKKEKKKERKKERKKEKEILTSTRGQN